MSFKINDLVVYGSDGVCRITEITTRNFRDKEVEYYVLSPVFNGSATLFVPFDCENVSGKLRPTVSCSEIEALKKRLSGQISSFEENESARKQLYKDIMKCGDFGKAVELIRGIHCHRGELAAIGKKLHMSDERFFKDAVKLICDEIAVVMDIDRDDAAGYFNDFLEG